MPLCKEPGSHHIMGHHYFFFFAWYFFNFAYTITCKAIFDNAHGIRTTKAYYWK